MIETLRGQERNWKLLTGIGFMTGALALAGCSNDKKTPTVVASPVEKTAEATGQVTSMTTAKPRDCGAVGKEVCIVFDALEGPGSQIVAVYSDISDSEAGRGSNNGEGYPDKDTVAGVCKAEGRAVSSNTDRGEEARSSNEWIRLRTNLYATSVYLENPQEVLSQLENCPK